MHYKILLVHKVMHLRFKLIISSSMMVECLGSLLAITFSEFDNKVGPKLKYSYHSDVLSNDVFESFADYVIMSKQLCEKVIIVVSY